MEKAPLSLKVLLSRLEVKSQKFSDPQISSLCTDMCLGLNFLHLSGVLHGDLSLGNFLVASDWTVKVADFGCSIITSTLNVVSGKRGTPEFHSLESAIGEVRFSSDIWAFGIAMGDIFEGRPTLPNPKLATSQADSQFETLKDKLSSHERKRLSNFLDVSRFNPLRRAEAFPILRRRQEVLDFCEEHHPKLLGIVLQCLQIEDADIDLGLRGTFSGLVSAWALLRKREGWKEVEFPTATVEEFSAVINAP
jgi:serine/threonine protein kinase